MSSTRHMVNESDKEWSFSFTMETGHPTEEMRRDDRLTWWPDYSKKGTGGHVFGKYVFNGDTKLWEFESIWYKINPKDRLAVRCREHVAGYWNFKDRFGYSPRSFDAKWFDSTAPWADGELCLTKTVYSGSLVFGVAVGGDITILDDHWIRRPEGVDQDVWDKRSGSDE